MAATRGTLEHRTLRLSWAAGVTIVATLVGLVVAQRVFVAAHRPLSWAAAAVVAAVLLDPLVDLLARRIPRVPAVLLVFLAVGAVAVGTTYLVFDDLQEALDRLKLAAPDAAASVEDRGDRLGEVARDLRLERRVVSFVDALEERVTEGDEVLRSTAGTAPTYLVSAIFTAFLITYGPRMAASALAQDPDPVRRRRLADVAHHGVARARKAIVLNVGVALTVGLAATGVAAWLDLPAPSAVGFAAGVMSLLPHVGLVFGAVPLLLLAVGFESGATAIVLAVVVVVLQVFDSFLIRPWIGRRSVPVGLLAPWVVALLGYAVYGIGGAAYSLAVATFVLAALDRLAEQDGEPTTAAA